VLYECVVGATGCTCVFTENRAFLIFYLLWNFSVLFFGGLYKKLRIYEYYGDVVLLRVFYSGGFGGRFRICFSI
jgi:hypothetical protein